MLLGTVFDTQTINRQLQEKTLESQLPQNFSDHEKLIEISIQIKLLQDQLNNFNSVKNKLENLNEMSDYLLENPDDKLIADLNDEWQSFGQEVNALYMQVLLQNAHDGANAIVKIHSGAGGTEACDWAGMLFRMYQMYADKNGFKLKVFDAVEGEGAGYKSITFSVVGQFAYGYLKSEHGVHRLVRISPFDSNKRRHTSFASVEVMPEIMSESEIVVNPQDIRIDTFRASGAGGQHVNKTDSAIRITHFPSGIVVTCQNERSQIQNRETAFKILKSKLLQLKEQEDEQKNKSLKGEQKKIEWGSQIRSYVFCPYTMVKDHRTDQETSNVSAVMDGQLNEFIVAYLKWKKV